MFHESFEESSEDHGICNVRDLEFIKAEDVGLPGEISRDGGDWVAAIAATDAGTASPADEAHGKFGGMHTFVHIDHEGVKVNATFAGDGGGKGVEEEVHEHGLSGANVAVEIETLGCIWWCGIWFGWGTGEEAGKEGGGDEECGRGDGWWSVSEEMCVKGLQLLDDATLVCVCMERARSDERVISLQGRVRRGETSSSSSSSSGGGEDGLNGGLSRDANMDGLRATSEPSRCGVLKRLQNGPCARRRPHPPPLLAVVVDVVVRVVVPNWHS